MSEKKTDPDSPAKRKRPLKTIVVALLLVGAGCGATFGLIQSGILGAGNAKAEKPRGPQLVLKGEDDPFAPPVEGDEKALPPVHGEGGSKYRTAYFTFGETFTSNLKGSDALIQLGLAASTRRDGRVLRWLDEHALAIRSSILVVVADTAEEDVATPEGKVRLQKRLTKAVNDVLVEEEGFGGVDQVYFRNFIVQ